MRIDVTVAVKNNARTLDNCLKSIRANIPVKQIVVVDNGSTDESVAIARNNGAVVVRELGFLGKVRYVQALNCSGEWIAVIDSDVYVYNSWWPNVSKYVKNPNIGMVLGMGESPGPPRIYQTFMTYAIRRYGATAFSNSLVRRDLMLSCKALLGTVPIEEDGVFVGHVKTMGKRVVTIKANLFFHDSFIWRNAPRAYFRWGRGIRISRGGLGLKAVAKILRDNIRDYLLFTIDTHRISLDLFFFLIYLWVNSLAGYVTFRKPLDHGILAYPTNALPVNPKMKA